MSFWTTAKIRDALASAKPPIVNPKPERLGTACYEMALGNEAFVSSESSTKRALKSGEQLAIPPGQLALLISEEQVDIPVNMIAFISIKASKKVNGLINVSGFHVDPGFRGRLKFSVYNAGPDTIVLDVGKPLFPIWFADLAEQEGTPYNGRHQGQTELTGDDVARLQGELASPAALTARIDKLDASITNWKVITASTLSTAIVAAITALTMLLRSSQASTPSTTATHETPVTNQAAPRAAEPQEHNHGTGGSSPTMHAAPATNQTAPRAAEPQERNHSTGGSSPTMHPAAHQ